MYHHSTGEEHTNMEQKDRCIKYCPGLPIWTENGRISLSETWTVPCEHKGPYAILRHSGLEGTHHIIRGIAEDLERLYDAYIKSNVNNVK